MRSPCCKKPSRIISVEGRYAGATVRRTRICRACGKSFATHESIVSATSPPCVKRCAIVAELTQKVEEFERLDTENREVRARVASGQGAKG